MRTIKTSHTPSVWGNGFVLCHGLRSLSLSQRLSHLTWDSPAAERVKNTSDRKRVREWVSELELQWKMETESKSQVKDWERRQRKITWGSTEGKLCLWTFQGCLVSSGYPFTAAGLQRLGKTLNFSGQACREGPSPSLGTESADAQRHRVSFITAASRQEPYINHVQCDSLTLPLPRGDSCIMAWIESVSALRPLSAAS